MKLETHSNKVGSYYKKNYYYWKEFKVSLYFFVTKAFTTTKMKVAIY